MNNKKDKLILEKNKHNCECHHDHKNGECSCGIEHSNNSKNILGIPKSILLIIIGILSLIVSYFKPIKIFEVVDPAIIAVILCGFAIFKGAFKALFIEHKVKSSLLISLSMIASIVLEILYKSNVINISEHGVGYVFAAGEIAVLMTIGEFLEERTINKTKKGIRELVKIMPNYADIVVGEKITKVNINKIKIGDIVLVKPNDRISVDGIIVSGETSIDQSNMTGESLPVDKAINDEVFAGTWNKSGAIKIKVTKLSKDTAVAKLIELTKEAEGKKAPISRIADRYASKIVPLACILSVLVFIFSYFVLKIDVIDAAVRGVTILVVFCPCALALATPTAIAAGLGNLSNKGILVKSGKAIETLAKINEINFDKTGTLTNGELKVINVIGYETDENSLIRYAKMAEKYSEHPIAKAILKIEHEDEINPDHTISLMGIGVKAYKDNDEIIVCQYNKLNDFNIEIVDDKRIEKMKDCGETIVAIVKNMKLIGVIGLADNDRLGAKETISKLNNMNIKTNMLTGDSEQSAKYIASKVGIKNYFYELMPKDKVDIINRSKNKNNVVCMVGDGVNDSPSLISADTSIAMGALGSSLAIESADIALMTSDLSKIPPLVNFSKKVIKRIKYNIIFAMSFNVIAVLLSAVGILNPVTGALFHNASSILVVASSAMLLKNKI